MVRAAAELVSVKVELLAALVEPTVTEPKFSDAGRRVAVTTPVPERLTVCLPALVLSLTVRVAERAPGALGVKVTETMQVPRAGIVPELGQVVAEVSLKSPAFAPVMVMLEMFKATVVLVSVSVEVLAALVTLTATEPKLSDAGKRVAVGTAAAPVPVRLMVCLPALVLSLTVSVAERAPVAVGVKVTVIRHVPSG